VNHRRIIAQLRAKAASTTFPEEAMNLRAKANQLEAKYVPATERTDPLVDLRTRLRQPGQAGFRPGPTQAERMRAENEEMDRRKAASDARVKSFEEQFSDIMGTTEEGGFRDMWGHPVHMSGRPWTDAVHNLDGDGHTVHLEGTTTVHTAADGTVTITVSY
jgi:hypothetical protein